MLNPYKGYLPIDVGNAPAIHIHEALGFQREGLLVDEFFSDGRYRSVIRMCLFQHQLLGARTIAATPEPCAVAAALHVVSPPAARASES